MIFYSLVIIISSVAIYLLNFFLNPMNLEWWVYLIWLIGFILAVFIIDALVATIIRKCMPEKWFSYKKRLFKTSDREIKFYKAIGVDKWKNHIPELGGFTNFHKNKVENPFDNEYISRFILEACYGIAIHLYSVPASFLILLLDFNMYTNGSILFLTMGLPVAIINSFLIVLPAFILKYNLPRLIRIHENNIKIQEKRLQKAN